MEVLQRTANRGSISDGGYEIGNSCKFEPDNSEAFNTTNQAAGNRKTWTFSAWVKRSELGSLQTIFGAGDVFIRFDTPDVIQTYAGGYVTTNRKFRDTSAWYHIVWLLDTTQSTASNRSRLYVNGVQETSFSGAAYPDQNADLDLGGQGASSNWIQVGRWYAGGRLFSGYMAEVHYVNGTVAEPTAFGEFDEDSGIWKPKKYTGGGYGTQGFYYKFDDSSSMGKDSSGEGHNANSVENITAADQSTDTPTNNFCTLNPLWTGNTSYVGVISEGATILRYSSGTKAFAKASMGVTNGKWYWEAMPHGTIGSQYLGIQTGVNFTSSTALSQDYTMALNTTGRYYSHSGSLSESGAGQFTNLTTSNVIGVALDLDSSTKAIKYYKDGSVILSLNLISNMQDETIFPFIQNYENRSFNLNFGGYTINTISSAATDENGYGTFEYAPPSGYYALCTKNLAEYG